MDRTDVKPMSRLDRLWVVAIIFALMLRVVLAFSTDLYFDEAYYWVWSRHLAGGYFDHAPMIAWLIALFGARLAALVCGVATAAAVFGLARGLSMDRSQALQATAVWCAIPVSAIAGVFATPDAPLLVFWTLSLWALVKNSPVGLGFAGGAALLSKYSSALLVPVHALDALMRRRWPWRSLFSAAIAGVLFLPPVLWNARHNWAGFRFQLHHGLGGGGGPRTFAEFLGGQLLLAGPVVAIWAVWWGVRGAEKYRLLRLSTLVPLVAFAFASWRARGEANWAATAYPAVAISLGAARPRWAIAAVFSGLLIIGAGTVQVTRPFLEGPALTPYVRLHGWGALARLRDEGITVAVSPSYELASEVAYYAGIPTWVEGATRPTQFDFWPRPEVGSKSVVAFVSEGQHPTPELEQRYGLQGPELEAVGYGALGRIRSQLHERHSR
jgi:4-amino-4-deoxy-L-arabinose transferase-like glycosyltransferase